VAQGSQALAVSVVADRAVFRKVRFLGNQDTVYTASKGCSANNQNCAPARQYFRDCYIEGNVDFIFGDGNSLFENCEMYSTAHNGGYVTAQGKSFASEKRKIRAVDEVPEKRSARKRSQYRFARAPSSSRYIHLFFKRYVCIILLSQARFRS
jgi:pectin methylesterase-like acyl-CoA thioesterase